MIRARVLGRVSCPPQWRAEDGFLRVRLLCKAGGRLHRIVLELRGVDAGRPINTGDQIEAEGDASPIVGRNPFAALVVVVDRVLRHEAQGEVADLDRQVAIADSAPQGPNF